MTLLKQAFDVFDKAVEAYLRQLIRPFLIHHEKFYTALNKALRSMLDANQVPKWFTANFVTYARTGFVVPCILLLALGHRLIPTVIVIAVDFGDFLDGVLARYWVDQKKLEEEELRKKDKASTKSTLSDEDSFEILSNGSPVSIDSWSTLNRTRTYGGFIDAICDKAFVVPCWIFLLGSICTSSYFHWLQFVTLFLLIFAEIASGCIRFRAYYTAGGVQAPKVEGFDFSSSAVKADHVGKAKQTFEMLGTACFIMYGTRYVGLILLMLALPLAYESVRRKIVSRVMYAHGMTSNFDHKVLKFWMQAKAMGSELVVGIPGSTAKDMVLNACSCSSVDKVVADAPDIVNVDFLKAHGIDFVICMADTKAIAEDVVTAKKCLKLGDNGIARPLTITSVGKIE